MFISIWIEEWSKIVSFITRAGLIAFTLNVLMMVLGYFLAKKSLEGFRAHMDPRKYNGAIFLGLDSPVVKSHGGTDFIGFSNSLDVCNKIVKGNLIEKIKFNIKK